jgi:hypothetical protein
MKCTLAIMLLGFAVTNFSCSYTAVGHRTTMYKNSNGWFPKDFDPASVTLLIETPPKSYKKKMDTLLKDYPCRYEFTNGNNSGSNNENSYRYIFKMKTWEVSGWQTTNIRSTYVTTRYADYYITDQVKKVDYPPTGYYTSRSNYYSALFEILKYIKVKYGPKHG